MSESAATDQCAELDERCRTYATIARAIRFVRAQAGEQPGLTEIAAHVGMSPHHFQRVFSLWAGVSPKRFLQYLTKEHARRLLRAHRDVLESAHEAGLSGPGRLHDLMVVCDAVTPGEVRALGAGLHIRHGCGPTPFGRAIVASTARGICHLQFVDDEAAAAAALREDWPLATLEHDAARARSLLERVFAGGLADRPLHILLQGSNFQLKVWEALLRVPPGDAVSYGTLAGMIGAPRAQRAVGTALAHNRIALLIPCHRVLREGGEIGQYRWGSERKHTLLALEAARAERR